MPNLADTRRHELDTDGSGQFPVSNDACRGGENPDSKAEERSNGGNGGGGRGTRFVNVYYGRCSTCFSMGVNLLSLDLEELYTSRT